MEAVLQRQSETIRVVDFSLDHTLDSGQAFRWRKSTDGAWKGVLGNQVVILHQSNGSIHVEANNLAEVASYFQWHVNLSEIVATFPSDEHMSAAVQSCWGLRLLRQDPWECLASFIASSTKQIVQIKQIVENLSRSCGSRIEDCELHSFPSVEAVAASTQEVLWNCKLGFRARNLLATARMIAEGKVDLARIDSMPSADARAYLCRLPGVGEKIANCVLLFAYGKHEAFPIDVWIERGLRQLYFRGKRNVTAKRLREFSQSYFGPHGGYAQQYLFHHLRTLGRRAQFESA